MADNENPTEPTGTPADSSDSATEAARLAAQADAEAAAAVEIAAAALSRAAIAKAAAARAEADRAARAAAQAASAAEAAGSDVAVRSEADTAVATPAAAPDAMTLQKVFYNATPHSAAAGADTHGTAHASAEGHAEQPPAKKSKMRTRTAGLLIGGAAAMVFALGGGGFALGATIAASDAQTSSTTLTPDTSDQGTTTTPDQSTTPDSGGNGYAPTMPFGGSGGSSDSGSSSGSSLNVTPASDEQTAGVVTIVSTLYYDESTQAAGTGVILTSDGEILTNNHVIDGATSIEVTVESTGKTYEATVVGSDSTNDIALLQLENASGLETSDTSNSTVAVGDEATSIGNAEGTGDLVAAAGVVTAVNESITVGNEYTGAQESLSGLIEINADVVSGDSGGPLVDSDGDVIGVVTAASSGSSDITGFAIPISTALDIVDQIQSGVATDTVQIGLPAFLGVQLATTQQAAGVTIGGVIAGTAAESAGLAAGDVITAVDGTAVTTSQALSDLVATHEPGDSIVVTYTNTAGASQQVTVTLLEGPAA